MLKGHLHQLRIEFIRQVAPFSTLPEAQIAHLAELITECYIKAGTIIFSEGEVGDQCYIIQSGLVDIFILDEIHQERLLATLEPPTLFGEIAVLTGAPRNASARMKEGGKLLILEKHHLEELIKYHIDTAESMVILSIERSHPIRNSNISHTPHLLDDGQIVIILKDKIHGRYFQLSELGWFIWQHIDGKCTIKDINFAVAEKYQIFAPDVVTDTIFNLVNAGFVSLPALNIFDVSKTLPPPKAGFKHKLFNFFRYHIAVHNIDHKITKSYNTVVHYLFAPAGKVFLSLIILFGLLSFGIFTPFVLNAIPSVSNPVLLIIAVLLINFILVIFHELGHAYATKATGRIVERGGVIFYWLGLVAYVDTSDMWLSSSRDRIFVNLAGPIIDLILAGISSALIWLTTSPDLGVFLWVLSLLLYFSVLKNLNPLYHGDGYHILSDLLNRPRLRFLVYDWLKTFNWKKVNLKKYRAETIFWIICLGFLALSIIFAFLLQAYLRYILPPVVWGMPTYHLLWILPGLVILHFLVRVWAMMRKLTHSLS